MPSPPPEIFTDSKVFFAWAFGVLLFICVGSLIYHIRKSDKNNERQWETLTDHERRISKVEGICEANHK
jgi:hypothetical protein